MTATQMDIHAMPMHEILNLKSLDFDGEQLHNCLSLVDFSGAADFYSKLRARMQETKTNAVPIWVSDGWLYNGHHRVAIASELGFAEMRVTAGDTDLSMYWREII